MKIDQGNSCWGARELEASASQDISFEHLVDLNNNVFFYKSQASLIDHLKIKTS